MITLTVSSDAWLDRRPQSLALLGRLLEATPAEGDNLFIDRDTVSREPASAPAASQVIALELIDLRDWVTEADSDGGTLNFAAVRRSAASFLPQAAVVIDASGFGFELVRKLLVQMRSAMFAAPAWPRCLALVVDASIAYKVVRGLERTFYVRPEVASEALLKQKVRAMSRAAALRRVLGHAPGPVWLQRLVQGLHDWLSKRPLSGRQNDQVILWGSDGAG